MHRPPRFGQHREPFHSPRDHLDCELVPDLRILDARVREPGSQRIARELKPALRKQLLVWFHDAHHPAVIELTAPTLAAHATSATIRTKIVLV